MNEDYLTATDFNWMSGAWLDTIEHVGETEDLHADIRLRDCDKRLWLCSLDDNGRENLKRLQTAFGDPRTWVGQEILICPKCCELTKETEELLVFPVSAQIILETIADAKRIETFCDALLLDTGERTNLVERLNTGLRGLGDQFKHLTMDATEAEFHEHIKSLTERRDSLVSEIAALDREKQERFGPEILL